MAQWNISEEELKEQFQRARENAREADAREPRARSARYDAASGEIVVELDNEAKFSFLARMAQGLRDASSEDLARVEVTPSGDGLQWESLDVDLGLLGLVRGLFGAKAWMAQIGREGGQVTSEAKAAAARINGAKGGRPKKGVETAWRAKPTSTSPSRKVTKAPRSVAASTLRQDAKTHVKSAAVGRMLSEKKHSASRQSDKSVIKVSGKSRKK